MESALSDHMDPPMSDLNVGNLDRLLRIVVGVALMGLAAASSIGALGWVGTALVLTGLSARCPLYALFAWRTTCR
jgi:hypothetical protein